MQNRAAIIGAGISGLTCGVVFTEHGWNATIFADETGQQTTSAAAAAVWFPYDTEPADRVIPWALTTYERLRELARDPRSGVSMIELRQFVGTDEIPIPDWARNLGARRISFVIPNKPVIPSVSRLPPGSSAPAGRRREGSRTTKKLPFASGFSLTVPLLDTAIYLDYLATRFHAAGGAMVSTHLNKAEEISRDFDFILNCAGIGARDLMHDSDLEPHRGQVAIMPKLDLGAAIVCDGPPLMYAIPRRHDCVFGGTNTISDSRDPSSADTAAIVTECSRVLDIDPPRVNAVKVGLRPFRKSGVRLQREKLRDGRIIIHNYGHGGAGFTLSWACAEEVWRLSRA